MDIAIIGTAFRLPGAVSNWETLNTVLEQDQSVIQDIPSTRFIFPSEFLSKYGQIIGATRAGLIDHVYDFDPSFFGLSPADAELMDPQHRLMLMLTWEALENARLCPDQLIKSATGVAVGACSYDYRERLLANPDRSLSARAVTGTYLSLLANRISYTFDWIGPSEPIDTACSSGLVAIHRCCEWLRAGTVDLAMAGAVHLILTPTNSMALATGNFLSRRGKLTPFDAHADGYVRGEGAAVYVLKRADDAIRDGDPIIGIIKGSAVSHGGRGHSLTAPQAVAQARVIQSALNAANLTPDDIDGIECHGTGTRLGDPIEFEGLTHVFKNRQVSQPLFVTAIKATLGHLEAAAGAAGLTAVLSAFKTGRLHGMPGTELISPLIDPSESQIFLVRQRQPLPTRNTASPTRVGICSYGFGGVNAHVIIESPPAATVMPTESINTWVFPISAKSEIGLNQMYRQLHHSLSQVPQSEWVFIQDCLMYDRAVFHLRAVVVLGGASADYHQLGGVIQPGDLICLGESESEWIDAASQWVDGDNLSWPVRKRPKSHHQVMNYGFTLTRHDVGDGESK